MNGIVGLATGGLGEAGIALAALRVGAGVFFTASGWNKLWDKERHARLKETLEKDKVPWVGLNQWWVPGWELVAGAGLALGAFAPFCAAVLLVVCMVASYCEAGQKVEGYKPINAVDRVADWLYLPEVLYGLILGAVVVAGPGRWALVPG